ncbi:MAG: UPF0182 family membrane protein [Nocardioidaceae bacterium]
MSGFFDEDSPEQEPRRPVPASPRRSRALIGTAVVLVAAFFMVSIFTNVWTDKLWFSSLGDNYGSVFRKVLGTRVLLFVVFGLLMGAVVAANVMLAYRFRPLFRPASVEQANLDRYREVIDPLRRWLLVALALVLGLFAGGSAAGQWRSFLLWRHAQPFGTTDPYFHKDVGFYVFDLPWLHYLVNFGMAVTVLSLLAAALVHYLFGGIRLQAKHDKFSGAAQVQMSVLLGVFVLFKAVDYYLDRFDLTTDAGHLFTGMGYTDKNAVLPSKNILMFIALICALLLFANVLRRTWMLPSVGLALLALSAILLGVIWPGIVQQFQVHPSEPDKEGPYIAVNIQATRAAFNLQNTKITPYNARLTLSPARLKSDAATLPGIRLLDPAIVSDSFEQLQQVRGYYSVKQVLDVDRYTVDGRIRDMVVAVRELDQKGLQASQQNWANLHTVYTHGYGMIAAYGNQRNAQDQAVTNNDGDPVWAEKDLPPRGVLSDMHPGGYQPRVYYGENSPSYSIVGREPGTGDVELDIPEGASATPRSNVYRGSTGVAIGGMFNKLLYALKFGDPNIVLSSRVNGNSKILYDRSPRTRVQKVAPWLTVDGDAYPAVVNGRIKWILDGYTTTDRYPNSEKQSLSDMTSDSLAGRTSYATLPSDQINYMRNSVKAVVDAYDGTVKLYAWHPNGQPQDPILKAWEGAFPNIVKPESSIPPALLAHMRYPEDMFKAQRFMLATYHVQNPRTFYGGSDRWRIPEDPADERQATTQPPYRLSVRDPGQPGPVFSLTSVYVPFNRQNLASFISVDGDASKPGYGTIRILRLPSNKQIPGPSQIANLFASNSAIQQRLIAFTRTKAKAVYGNLLTLPIGNGLLYVQPLYTLRQSGQGTYPVLRYVLASFGKDAGIGTTLTGALDNVLGVNAPPPSTNPPNGPGSNTPPSNVAVPPNVRALLAQADAKYKQAQRALKRGDLSAYATATSDAQQLVEQALKEARQSSPSASPSPSSKSSPSGKSSKPKG